MVSTDFAIIGGGIIGVCIALNLKQRFPNGSVTLIEKEPAPGAHASGRNSGVLHAGFYYSADSLKARFSRIGNQALQEFCTEHGLPINRCGKLVVARDADDLESLAELSRRAKRNGVTLHEISASEAREIEPRVKTFEKALFSPTTATVEPPAILERLHQMALERGVRVKTQTRYLGRDKDVIVTSHGRIAAGYLVNTAGLYADRVARDYGFGLEYRILPFKGLYLYSDEPAGAFRTNIYPVPDLRNPFLGVHFTVAVDGRAKIGPTAIPCLWREQYGWGGMNVGEFFEIARTMTGLFFRGGFDFRSLAFDEMKKYTRRYMVGLAAHLAEGVHPRDYKHWGRPGIRAQLVRVRDRQLVQDFCMEGDARSFHVLNAVSPAFTCAFPFADYVCDQIQEKHG